MLHVTHPAAKTHPPDTCLPLQRSLAAPPAGCRWRRVLLKLSGEALAGDAGFGIDADLVLHFAAEVAAMSLEGVQARLL